MLFQPPCQPIVYQAIALWVGSFVLHCSEALPHFAGLVMLTGLWAILKKTFERHMFPLLHPVSQSFMAGTGTHTRCEVLSTPPTSFSHIPSPFLSPPLLVPYSLSFSLSLFLSRCPLSHSLVVPLSLLGMRRKGGEEGRRGGGEESRGKGRAGEVKGKERRLDERRSIYLQ